MRDGQAVQRPAPVAARQVAVGLPGSRRARSATSVTIALTRGPTSSIRRRWASSSSTALISRARSSRAISTAVR